MSIKRIATLSAAAAVLAAMIAGATTSGVRRAAPVTTSPNTTAIELQGAELAAEVARLRARLRPTDEPQEPARNLFQFSTRSSRPAEALPVAIDAVSAPVAALPQLPSLTLVGIATDSVAGEPVRTAIISGLSEVFLVKEGETIASEYRVGAIGADGVDLTPLTGDGPAVTLRLQQ
jgi:hypothetical protein